MKAVGVIVEYNPFHNGHLYHLEKSREAAGADVAIAVMSGNFLQRGEPALLSKWARAEMALKAGADLVFELPYKFAVQNAETFADGAVSILAAAGCSSLCFGSESGDIGTFIRTADLLDKNSEAYQERIKHHIGDGNSYPKSLSLAFKDLGLGEDELDLSKPNNILGFQYTKSVHARHPGMKLLTVERKSAGYHDEHFSSETIASATSIRKALFSDGQELEEISSFVPETSLKIMEDYQMSFGAFHHWEMYWPFLKYRLLQMSAPELKEIYEMEEGLENRFLASALKAGSFREFMESVKTKRYTWTRLQRACVHVLTNTKKEEMLPLQKSASYLRLLGMSEDGRNYLNGQKGSLALPLVSKLSSFPEEAVRMDIRAARIYASALPGPFSQRLLEMEYSQPPIYLKNSRA
jgi:predicted nucleotidyltransferase